MTVVVTGATGFVGSHVAEAALARGLAVRALVRRAPTGWLEQRGAEIARGDVTDGGSLEAAFAGAAAVVHVAGVIAARGEAGFARVNVFGARLVGAAARTAGVRRVVLVSSLAARGPAGAGGPVTDYGRSKLAGEAAMRRELGDAVELVVVRPTAVYGPRDRAILPLFRLAAAGVRPALAGGGRLSFIHGADLGAALAALVLAPAAAGRVLEASDGGEHTWEDAARLLGQAVGRPGAPLAIPGGVLRLAAAAADAVARLGLGPTVFGRDKLAELLGSWPADAPSFWRAAGLVPRFDFAAGAHDTARWYREVGWL